jgi:hypothetical protein
MPHIPTFEARLATLSDGRSGLRATMRVDIRPADSTSPEASASGPVLDFVASDETLDRYDEIILASGWRLENYRRNPVFQNAHQYGDIIFTLGRALITEVRCGTPHSEIRTPHLYQRVEFATAVNPMARIAYGLYQGRFLNAVSVGFIPLRWEDATGAEHQVGRAVPSAPPPGSQHSALPEGSFRAPHSEIRTGARRRYLEQELLEVSAVGIPANPSALALAVKSGAVAKSDLKDTLDLLRQLTAAAPAGRGLETHSLLPLARTLRNLLRLA